MMSFQELAASRRQWLNEVLIPWCRQAELKELREAEHDWINVAGRVDPAATLWTWAWSRFPALVHEGSPGLSETREVQVRLRDGSAVVGYPDNRESSHGTLMLVGRDDSGTLLSRGPFRIDEISDVTPTEPQLHAPLPASSGVCSPTILPPETPVDVRV